MNARQAKRIVLWMNGHYLIAADHYGLDDAEVDAMAEVDLERLGSAQRELGLELIRRSGIQTDLPQADLLSTVLGIDDAEGEGP
jgi:hypothetical protein